MTHTHTQFLKTKKKKKKCLQTSKSAMYIELCHSFNVLSVQRPAPHISAVMAMVSESLAGTSVFYWLTVAPELVSVLPQGRRLSLLTEVLLPGAREVLGYAK